MADFIVPSSASPETDAQQRLKGPIHAQRHVRIVCIGAGASGLLMAYKLQRHFTNYSLTVYEKNPEVSGTWFENRYPGYAYSLFGCVQPHREAMQCNATTEHIPRTASLSL